MPAQGMRCTCSRSAGSLLIGDGVAAPRKMEFASRLSRGAHLVVLLEIRGCMHDILGFKDILPGFGFVFDSFFLLSPASHWQHGDAIAARQHLPDSGGSVRHSFSPAGPALLPTYLGGCTAVGSAKHGLGHKRLSCSVSLGARLHISSRVQHGSFAEYRTSSAAEERHVAHSVGDAPPGSLQRLHWESS